MSRSSGRAAPPQVRCAAAGTRHPNALGIPLAADTVTTWGIPVGVGVIFMAFILTGVYVQRANGEFDRLNQEILNEAQQ